MRARELELQRESWRVRSKELDVERDLKIKAGAGKTRAGGVEPDTWSWRAGELKLDNQSFVATAVLQSSSYTARSKELELERQELERLS